jgi:hypothetical protein
MRVIALAATGIALAMPALAADLTIKKPPPDPHGFYRKFLAPKFATDLHGEEFAATEFANPATNPWMRDERTVGRVEKSAVGATTGALKEYAVHALGLDVWTQTVSHTAMAGTMLDPTTPGTRLRFSFAHMAPRADLIVPGAAGRFIVGVDARGRLGTSFDSPASKFSYGVTVDPLERAGTFTIGGRF